MSTVLNHGTPSSPSTCNVDSTSKADVMGIEALGYYHVPPEQSLMELAASAGIGLVQQGLGRYVLNPIMHRAVSAYSTLIDEMRRYITYAVICWSNGII